MGKGKKKMANPSFEVLKPNHDEYVENFQALTNGLNNGSQDRDIVMKQVDHLLDLHAADYPELITEYIVKRGMEVLEV